MNADSVLVVGTFDCNDRVNTFLVSSELGVPELEWEALGGPSGDVARQGVVYPGGLIERVFRVRIRGNDGDDLDAWINALRDQVPGCDSAPDESTATIGAKGRTLTGTVRIVKSKRIAVPVEQLFVGGDEATVEIRLACEPYVYEATETLASAVSKALPAVVDLSAQSGQYAAPYDLLFDFGGWECAALFVGRYPDATATIADFAFEATSLAWSGGSATTDVTGYPDGSGNTVQRNQSATEVYADIDVTDLEPGEYLVLAKCKATTANAGTVRHTYCDAVNIPTTGLDLLSLGLVTLPCSAVRGSAASTLRLYLAGDGANYGYLNAIFLIPASFGGVVGWQPASGHAHVLRWEDQLLYADDVADLGSALGGRQVSGLGGLLVAVAEKVAPAPTTDASVTVSEDPRWEQLPSDGAPETYVGPGSVLGWSM